MTMSINGTVVVESDGKIDWNKLIGTPTIGITGTTGRNVTGGGWAYMFILNIELTSGTILRTVTKL